MEYLLGTDIGTSGTKTILMDTEGNLIAKHLVECIILSVKNSTWTHRRICT